MFKLYNIVYMQFLANWVQANLLSVLPALGTIDEAT
jgi:hypothetical protein